MVIEVINQSANYEVQVPCIKCSDCTAHEIIVSVEHSGTEPRYSLDWWHNYQIIRCKGSKVVSYREVSCTSEDYIQVGEEEWE